MELEAEGTRAGPTFSCQVPNNKTLLVDIFAILESNVFLQMNQCISSDNSRYLIILQMAREKFVMSDGLLSG